MALHSVAPPSTSQRASARPVTSRGLSSVGKEDLAVATSSSGSGLIDLAGRFAAARYSARVGPAASAATAAAQHSAPEAPPARERSAIPAASASSAGGEAEALAEIEVAERPEVLRRMFWNGWRLGRSAARWLARPLAVDELAPLLAGLPDVPCVMTDAEPQAATGGFLFSRSGCGAGRLGNGFVCDAYRESLDGLVCGLGSATRFARRESVGHGGERCVDVLYPEQLPDERFTPVPAAVVAHLAPALEMLAARGLEVTLLGVAELDLYVSLVGKAVTLCSGTRQVWLELLRRHLREGFPAYGLVDASPRAVVD